MGPAERHRRHLLGRHAPPAGDRSRFDPLTQRALPRRADDRPRPADATIAHAALASLTIAIRGFRYTDRTRPAAANPRRFQCRPGGRGEPKMRPIRGWPRECHPASPLGPASASTSSGYRRRHHEGLRAYVFADRREAAPMLSGSSQRRGSRRRRRRRLHAGGVVVARRGGAAAGDWSWTPGGAQGGASAAAGAPIGAVTARRQRLPAGGPQGGRPGAANGGHRSGACRRRGA